MSSMRYFFLTLSFLAIAGYTAGNTPQGTSSGSAAAPHHQVANGRIVLPEARPAQSQSAFQVMNPGALVLDSVYGYNWANNAWALNTKSYQTRNSQGLVIETLLKRYSTTTGKYENYGRILYDYFGTGPDIESDSTQLWYSTYWLTFQYNHYLSKDLLDETYTKEWNPVKHKFIGGTRFTYQYNDSLLPAEVIKQSFDTTIQDWQNTFRSTFSYTALMQPQEEIIYLWNSSTSTWVYSYKYSDVYDATNALVGHLEYTWNDISSSWLNTIRIYYHNTPASMPDTAVMEAWNLTFLRWDSVEKTYYTYNQFNWLMNVRTHKMNDMTGNWYHSYQMYYTYFPATGYKKSETGNVWDTLHLAYITDHYMEFDSVDQMIERYDRYVNLGTFQIVGGIRDVYTYSSTSDTLSKVNQEWNLLTGNWQYNSQKLFTYDSHNLLTEELVQDWVSASSSWENSKKSVYFYSEFFAVNEHPGKEKLCFYANPMTTGTTINCPGLNPLLNYIFELYSIRGEGIYRAAVAGNATFKIDKNVACGNYILRITSGGKTVYQDKVIILN